MYSKVCGWFCYCALFTLRQTHTHTHTHTPRWLLLSAMLFSRGQSQSSNTHRTQTHTDTASSSALQFSVCPSTLYGPFKMYPVVFGGTFKKTHNNFKHNWSILVLACKRKRVYRLVWFNLSHLLLRLTRWRSEKCSIVKEVWCHLFKISS